jgi:uncharacterized protein YggE
MKMHRALMFALAATAATSGLAQNGSQTMVVAPALQGTRLDIVAEGEVTRAPDVVSISAGVVTQSARASDAMAENARRMAATVTALRKAGVADRDIRTSAINLSPQYRYGENVPPTITGYQASNQVEVRFRDVSRAGSVLDALVAVGANQINGPTFGLDKPEEALDEARGKAVQTARARAELYAKAAGLRVKRIVAISEGGGFAPQPPIVVQSMRAKAVASDTPIEPGEQKLNVTVSVSFELE